MPLLQHRQSSGVPFLSPTSDIILSDKHDRRGTEASTVVFVFYLQSHPLGFLKILENSFREWGQSMIPAELLSKGSVVIITSDLGLLAN